jgi:anti-sigma factor RsiW
VSCREFIELIDTYLAGEAAPDRLVLCERHLAACPSCVAYLDSYRKTIALGRSAFQDPEGPLPAEVPEELVQALMALRPGEGS